MEESVAALECFERWGQAGPDTSQVGPMWSGSGKYILVWGPPGPKLVHELAPPAVGPAHRVVGPWPHLAPAWRRLWEEYFIANNLTIIQFMLTNPL